MTRSDGNTSRAKGYTMTVFGREPDALNAQDCIGGGIPLLTRDRDFRDMLLD